MRDQLRGVIIGTAVGDALGLPWEGMSADAIRARAGDRLDYVLLGGRGLVSDDTEQTWLIAAAVLAARGDVDAFQSTLARYLRWWFLALPPGIGLGTARSLIRSLAGVPAGRSGVMSAGNGAAMRAAVLGVALAREQVSSWVRASTVITHGDPRADAGARVVAIAAHLGARHGLDRREWQAEEVLRAAEGEELVRGLRTVIACLRGGESPDRLTSALGVPGFVTGYVNHTVPAAVYCWLRNSTFEGAVSDAVRMGGDTDTVAAIAGALMGATLGFSQIPSDRVDGLADRPMSRARLLEAADALAAGCTVAPALPWLGLLARNLALLPVFVAHILWRRRPW